MPVLLAAGTTTNPTTTVVVPTYANLAEMSIPLSLQAPATVVAHFAGTFGISTTAATGQVRLALDGGNVRGEAVTRGAWDATYPTQLSTFGAWDLAPGSYTLSVQWALGVAGTLTATGIQRYLLVRY